MKRAVSGRWALAACSALAIGALAGTAAADSMSDLVAAAKQEGELTIIAVPHDWCGYGAIIDGFKAAYGLKVNELNPDAGSGDEIEAVKSNKGNKGPQAPDVLDVGLSFGPSAKADVAASASLVRLVCFIFAPVVDRTIRGFLPGRCRPPQTAAW